MKYSAETIPVCTECAPLEQKLCSKCGIAFCQHYSSPTDIRYCGNCMADFTVLTETEIRITEKLSDSGSWTYRKRDIAKSLKLQGTDWLFAAAKVSSLNDEELEATIEYHGAIKSLMLSEREDRRTERFNKMSRIVVKLQNRSDLDATGAIKSKPGKNKTSKSSKSNNTQIADAMALLLKSGISAEKLAQMLGGK